MTARNLVGGRDTVVQFSNGIQVYVRKVELDLPNNIMGLKGGGYVIKEPDEIKGKFMIAYDDFMDMLSNIDAESIPAIAAFDLNFTTQTQTGNPNTVVCYGVKFDVPENLLSDLVDEEKDDKKIIELPFCVTDRESGYVTINNKYVYDIPGVTR